MNPPVKSTILIVLFAVTVLLLSPSEGGCQWVNHRNTLVSPHETQPWSTPEPDKRSEPSFSRDTGAEAGDEVPYHPSESAGYPSGEETEYGPGYQTPPPTPKGYPSGNSPSDGSEYATGAPAPSGSDDIFDTINNIIGVVDRGMDIYERGRNLKRDRDYGTGSPDPSWDDSGSPDSPDPSWDDPASSGSPEPSGSGWWGTGQPPSSTPPPAELGQVELPHGVPQIAGTWRGTNGRTYHLYQFRKGFSWTIEGATEQGTGHFKGKGGDMQLVVSWQGQFGFGETTGKIIQMQGDQATRIGWNNGIIFERQ